jgi:hypothetical protein
VAILISPDFWLQEKIDSIPIACAATASGHLQTVLS